MTASSPSVPIVALLALAQLASGPALAQIGDRVAAAPWHGASLAAVEVQGAVSREQAAEIENAVRDRLERLDPDTVRTALAIAHSRAVGGDIEARVVASQPGEAVLRLVVHAEPLVVSVDVEGVPEGVGWQDQVLVKPGERLIENRLLRTVYELEEVIEDAGYLDARVTLAVEPVDGGSGMAITFAVTPGELYQVREVIIDPPLPQDVPEVESRLANKAGQRYRPGRLREDTDRIRRHLVHHGYRQARTREAEVTTEGPGVRLRYPVDPGPRMEIEFVGFDVKELRRRNRLPALRDQGFDEALIPATTRVLENFMQSKGFYHAVVEVEQSRGEDAQRVTFVLTPGDKIAFEELVIDGAESFDRKRLETLMLTTPERSLVDSELAEDVENLRSFYVRQGFAEVAIESDVGLLAEGGMRVEIVVVEGPRRTVRSVDILGADQEQLGELTENLPIVVGGPFHRSIVEAGVAELQRRYRERGYRSSFVTSRAEAAEDDPLGYDVTYQVLEGHQVQVGEVFLRGLDRTEPGFVRKVLGLRPGDILSTDRMLEAEGRLFQLGLFSRVDVRSSPAAPFAAAEDLVVEVEEAPVNRFSYGVGWDSEDGPRGVLGYVRNNWLGRGLAWNLDAVVSDRVQLYRLLLTQPWVAKHRTPVTYSVFSLDEDRESFELQQAGVQVGARQQRGRTTTGLLATWRRNEPSEGAFGLDREIAPVEITSVTPSLLVDRRDDAFDPSHGWNGLVEIEQAFSVLGTEEAFTKAFAQASRYLDLGRAGTLAGSARAGWINPVSTAATGPELGLLPPDFDSAQVHISERFVSGGRSSHRAYNRFELGERGETLLLCDDLPEEDRDCQPGEILPVGGTAMGLVNLDWRFPLGLGLGGVVFVDAGNVWADWDHADQVKVGAGVGVRYSSPVGPLRLEIGWKLDREEFEDPYVIFISVGNPF